MDIDEKVEVQVIDPDDLELLDLDDEVRGAVVDALKTVGETLREVDVDEIGESTQEVEKTLRELEEELEDLEIELDQIMDEVEVEIRENDQIKINRELNKEDVELVRKRIKEIVKEIIRQSLDEDYKMEEEN